MCVQWHYLERNIYSAILCLFSNALPIASAKRTTEVCYKCVTDLAKKIQRSLSCKFFVRLTLVYIQLFLNSAEWNSSLSCCGQLSTPKYCSQGKWVPTAGTWISASVSVLCLIKERFSYQSLRQYKAPVYLSASSCDPHLCHISGVSIVNRKGTGCTGLVHFALPRKASHFFNPFTQRFMFLYCWIWLNTGWKDF